jgi:imidazolonepropionase-like amidohydrolase
MTQVSVLQGGQLFDGTGAPPIPDGAIRFEGSKIVAVGHRADFGESGFEGAEVIDVQGRTILPGLVNCHEHLDLHFSYGSFAERITQSHDYWMVRTVRNALLAICEGVTTVRDLASRNGNSIHLRQAVSDGLMIGPRVLTCGRPIAMTGGHGWQLCIEADGVDGVRRAAREVIKSGADLVKCMASGDFMVRSGDEPWHTQFSPEELRAVFEEAHWAGKLTTVHCHPAQGILWAVEAGVDCIEHGALMDRESAEAMAQRGVPLVPTLGETFTIAERGEYLGKPDWLIEMIKATVEARWQTFKLAVDTGVRMGVGTDTSDTMAEEMEWMVKGGMTPGDVLVAATCMGAKICGLGDRTGTLEPGKWADIIVLDGDPIQHISDIARVELVFKEGVSYRPAELRPAIGRYPL